MRKSFMVAVVLLLAGLAYAARGREDVKLTGYIIDNACGAKNAGDPDKIKGHSKTCALMPPCVKSGYAVYADGKLYKFDQAGNAKAEALLKSSKAEKGIQVTVEGEKLDGDVIKVKSLSEVT
jgi:hypothetical protein